MALTWAAAKDPNEVLDYEIDWAGSASVPGRTYGDVITVSTWTVPAGLTKDSDSHSDLVCTIWLSGGTAGENYELLNRIVTTGGRTHDQTVKLKCRNK